MIDLKNAYEIKNILDNKIIDKIEDELGNIIYESWKDILASGVPPLTLVNCKGVDLMDYKLFGNSEQDGTPTTDTPIEIESVGDKTKNLFDISNYRVTNGNVTIKDNTITLLNSTEVKSYIVYRIPVSEYAGKTIYFSANYTTNLEKLPYHNIRFRRADDTNIEQYSGQPPQGRSYDIPLETDYISLELYAANLFADGTVVFSNVMVEVGDTQTEYEQYGYRIPIKVSNDTENVTTNIYLDEPLRKIGDYADYIDFKNKKVVRNIKKETITSKNVGRVSKGNENNVIITTDYNDIKISADHTSSKDYIKSNCFGIMQGKISTTWVEAYNINTIGKPGLIKQIWIGIGTNITTTTEAKTYIDALKPDLYYVLETPTEETIELPNIPTIKGTTIIEINTEVQPSNLEVVYKGKEVK